MVREREEKREKEGEVFSMFCFVSLVRPPSPLSLSPSIDDRSLGGIKARA